MYELFFTSLKPLIYLGFRFIQPALTNFNRQLNEQLPLYLVKQGKYRGRHRAVLFMKPENMDVLEGLLDQLTLSAILEMLERLCHKKAENLREHWQDEVTAKLWDKAARQIEQLTLSDLKVRRFLRPHGLNILIAQVSKLTTFAHRAW